MKKILGAALVAAAALALASCGSKVPAGTVSLVDNFEDSTNYWVAVGDSWDQWGAHNLSLTADLTKEWKSEGAQAAVWTFDIATADSSKQASFWVQPEDTDWTGVKYVVADIYNPNAEEIGMVAAIQDSVEWAWSQSPEVKIAKGKHKNVVFDLAASNDGKGVSNAQAVFELIMNVTGENKGGKIYIDNIRWIK